MGDPINHAKLSLDSAVNISAQSLALTTLRKSSVHLPETHQILPMKQYQLPYGQMPQDFKYVDALNHLLKTSQFDDPQDSKFKTQRWNT
jgi:hypothetical protein